MKILYFYQELPNPMFQWHRTHFIEELSHHNVIFDCFNPLLCPSIEESNEKLLEKAKSEHYDLFLSNTCYYKMLFAETVIQIKKMGIPTLTIAWDNLMVPYMDKDLAPYFDLVWLTGKDNMNMYKKWGVKCCYAPFAANPYLFSYEAGAINRHICFIGNPHGGRSLMINKLTESGVDVNVYCGKNKNQSKEKPLFEVKYDIVYPSIYLMAYRKIGYSSGRKQLIGSLINKMKGQTTLIDNQYLHRYPSLSHEDMVREYASAALSISFTSVGHTDILDKPLQWTFLRNFEIPMCGGVQLCRYTPEIASYFEEGKEIVLYHNNDELADKANYYLKSASDTEISHMKEAARQRSLNEHTWWHRFTKAFDILGLKY